MAKVTITFFADPTKGSRIEVEGHAGPGCQQLTEAVEKALGQTVKDEQTEEFYRTQTHEQQQLQ